MAELWERSGASSGRTAKGDRLTNGLLRVDGVLVVEADAVGLGPDADLAGDRLGQGVLEQKLAVEPALELRTVHGDLHVLPGLHGKRDFFAAALDELAHALIEGPEDEVVFLAVEADGEVVAVRLEVEEDAGALVERAVHHLEAHGDFAVAEVVHALRHGVGEVG